MEIRTETKTELIEKLEKMIREKDIEDQQFHEKLVTYNERIQEGEEYLMDTFRILKILYEAVEDVQKIVCGKEYCGINCDDHENHCHNPEHYDETKHAHLTYCLHDITKEIVVEPTPTLLGFSSKV